ncbi:MAG: excinuclease ABC subunit UvrB [Holosporales bacterium]|jgi:excinuclease ABC subunit B|nr:excinuclease ABC subunit UvrB [Holosporales bacterium]
MFEFDMPAKLFKLQSDYVPAGDQPKAIKDIVAEFSNGKKDQVLLGVTGSGKTFTVANVIAELNTPALIMAPNKTLAAQLYGEMKGFFPDNAVEYFVSYYDYYQPEAYVPKIDTFIEKKAAINQQIDRMRHSATQALLERRDVIVVASVSCIYGIGSPEMYGKMVIAFYKGDKIDREGLIRRLIGLQYTCTDFCFERGTFCVNGDTIDIFPSHMEDKTFRIMLFGDEIEEMFMADPLTGKKLNPLDSIKVYANSHYVTSRDIVSRAICEIKSELVSVREEFRRNELLVEAQRINERIKSDLEMLELTGYCRGIENYSRYLTCRAEGEPPPTLFEYLPKDALLIVDESHVAVPQIGGMYNGDRQRKKTLVNYGFRLPSCLDNRPLKFEEWERMRPQTLFVSATPGKTELEKTNGVVAEQIIRPTGLIDPECFVRPTEHQVDDLINECAKVISCGSRILVTTLTKRMAEDLTKYLSESGLKVNYIHSDIDTLERIEIIKNFRLGIFDVLIGINLLREGLDIPECGLVAILDADKEGFLRSKTSLIQTIGRAARNIDGKAIFYADSITESMRLAIEETNRRRAAQERYNKEHGITPDGIKKSISNILGSVRNSDLSTVDVKSSAPYKNSKMIKKHFKDLEKKMKKSASDLDFELAAKYRDEIEAMKKNFLVIANKTQDV